MQPPPPEPKRLPVQRIPPPQPQVVNRANDQLAGYSRNVARAVYRPLYHVSGHMPMLNDRSDDYDVNYKAEPDPREV
eukprot:760318-Pyramimonas_sp.AAC.1